MRIFKDLLTGDEMFTDVYPMRETENGILLEVQGKFVIRTDDIDDKAIGGNASAENVEECALPSTSSGVNIVLSCKLVKTYFTKKEYKVYIKKYAKRILEELRKCNPDRVPGFKAGAEAAVNGLIAKVEDCECFIGESMDPDGMVALLEYRENDPYMIFFKDGLTEEKCPRPRYCRANLSVPLLATFFGEDDTRPDFRLSRQALAVLLDLLNWER